MCDNGVGQGAAHAHSPLAHTGVTASFLWGRVLERKSPEVVGVCQMKWGGDVFGGKEYRVWGPKGEGMPRIVRSLEFNVSASDRIWGREYQEIKDSKELKMQ